MRRIFIFILLILILTGLSRAYTTNETALSYIYNNSIGVYNFDKNTINERESGTNYTELYPWRPAEAVRQYNPAIFGYGHYSAEFNESSIISRNYSNVYDTNDLRYLKTLDFLYYKNGTGSFYNMKLIFIDNYAGNDVPRFTINSGSTGSITASVKTSAGQCSIIDNNVTDGVWHHLIMSINDTHIITYINGRKNTTDCSGLGNYTQEFIDNNITSLRIFGNGGGAETIFHGMIDNFILSNITYTDDMAYSSYNNGNYINWSNVSVANISEPPEPDPPHPLLKSRPKNLTFKGTGEFPSPYIIENCPHLWSMDINESAYFILGNDIDCSGYRFNFSESDDIDGTLNGRGYSILNILIDENNTDDDLSMFRDHDGIIKNIWFENATVRRASSSSFGKSLLFNSMAGGQAINLHFRNINISPGKDSTYVGLINGIGTDGSYINISAINVSIQGAFRVGGLNGNQAGYYENIHLENFNFYIFNQSETVNTAKYIGGIQGHQELDCKNCYLKNIRFIEGKNTTPDFVGGIGGYMTQSELNQTYIYNISLNCTNHSNCGVIAGRCGGSYNDLYVDNQTIEPTGTYGTDCPTDRGQLPENMLIKETYTGFDFVNIWDINNGTDTPYLLYECDTDSCFSSRLLQDLNITDLNVTDPLLQEYILLNQIYEYYNGIWNFDYLINSIDPIYKVNITIDDNDSNIYINQEFNKFSANLNSSNIQDKNPFQIDIFIQNIYGDTATRSQVFNISDSVNPVCQNISNSSINQSEIYNFSLSCQDESFIFVNMTCQDYSNIDQGIDQKDYNLSDSFNVTQNNTCLINYNDKFGNSGFNSFFLEAIPPPNVTIPDDNLTFNQTVVNVNIEGVSDQTIINIFMLIFWVVLLILTLTLKGVNGKTIGFLNILQMVIGFVAGGLWVSDYFLVGFPVMMIGVFFFVGLILNDR